jgi:RimJ/RimL family protein N-acetyltransferase
MIKKNVSEIMGTASDKLYKLKNGVTVVIRTAKESHLVLVAEIDSKIVGQLDFSSGHRKRNSHTGDFGMGVHKDFRGLGIGTLLLKALIEWAKNNTQIEKINLCVHQTNDRAIATYKKIGFEIEGVRTKDLKYPNGVYVDTVLMGLHL